ncbi:hypothetical protein [Sulfitobacter geojensis]|uniref:hypothetical protein n=2 Tax=Sulfitobacter geojensis TaxID=1342299 RepID=UPI001849A409|nr:hypothetical protein [Sulfitobacter geojensis]NYI27408.1 hypothetical protein [Sulfitobacter geojensis]
MKMKTGSFSFANFAAIWLAALLSIVTVQSVAAQSTRNWDRRVAAGSEMEFQWLNYDEKTCKDRGHPRLIINTPPSLGTYRAERRKFTQRTGRCKGKKLSVLLVYYVAGRTKGRDRTSYTIRGAGDIRINLKMRIY